ncbi:MAG TPA: histidine kinase dimerization/phospho-acceptor domain-containing protein, partial [Tepidisphaeraceae bacterium]|nr:histidine kinase dimerization/phospho-acceptor domain-containing protein [Tepidisphaeraceae bacterium]
MGPNKRLIFGAVMLFVCGAGVAIVSGLNIGHSAGTFAGGGLVAGCLAGACVLFMLALRACHRRERQLVSDIKEYASGIRPRAGNKAGNVQEALAALVLAAERSVFDATSKLRELEIQVKLAQAERQHAEAIVYSISDAVLVTDPSDELVLANESAAKTFEFDLAQSGHVRVDKLLHDPKMISLIREMRQTSGKTGRRIVEHRVPTPHGERIFKITLSSTSDDADGAGGVVAVLHDMTGEKDVSEMKNDFVSMVSHELRTPLASIKAYAEMLLDGEAEDAETQRQFYEVIQNEANRLGRLIDNILTISRIEAGLARVNKQPHDLEPILRDAIEAISIQTRQKRITLTENLEPSVYQTLADRDMLYQAILNLLTNAVKYTPAGGAIAVEMSRDPRGKKVLIKITDTGVGIPPKDLPFVFDKFYRAEANNRIAPGTGLGL